VLFKEGAAAVSQWEMGDLRSSKCIGQSTSDRRGRCSWQSITKESACVERADTEMIDSFFEVIRRQLTVIERRTITSWTNTRRRRDHMAAFFSLSYHHHQLYSPPYSSPKDHAASLFRCGFIQPPNYHLPQSELFDGLAVQDTLSSDITVTDSTKSHPLLSGNAS